MVGLQGTMLLAAGSHSTSYVPLFQKINGGVCDEHNLGDFLESLRTSGNKIMILFLSIVALG
jgi:hypothetical protein